MPRTRMRTEPRGAAGHPVPDGNDQHTSLEDGDPFGFQNTLRKAMESSMDRMLWDGLQLSSDGMPQLEELDIQYAISHDHRGDPVDFNDHDSITTATFPPDATVVNFGQRRSGKSYFTRQLMYEMHPFYPRGIVFSDTDRMLRFYQDFIPKSYIFQGYNPDIQEAANELQRRFKEDVQLYDNMKEYEEHWMRMFVIYDDVINRDGMFHHKMGDPLRRLFVNGRHFEVLTCFNTQYPRAIPPTMRSNVDRAFMFNCGGKNEIEVLFELFGQHWQVPRLFSGVLAAHTEDHAMLAVDNQIKARRLVDRYKWYRAPEDPPPEFHMGTIAYQQGGYNDDGIPLPPMSIQP